MLNLFKFTPVLCPVVSFHSTFPFNYVYYIYQDKRALFGNSDLLISTCIYNVNMCSHNAVCFDGSLRIIDGNTYAEGRVEVCQNGSWATVCDEGWDDIDATVACRGFRFEWGEHSLRSQSCIFSPSL